MSRFKFKVRFPQEATHNAVNYHGKKETVATYQVVAATRKGIEVPVEAHVYMSYRSDGSSPIYASVWISGKGRYCSGTGKASGYGYCKTSEAIAEAIESAGIDIGCRIGGTGMRSVNDALIAIAKSMGYRGALRVI